MLTKVEITGFVLGILAIFCELVVLFNRQSFPAYVFELFRGGNIGGILVGVAVMLGFVSVILFIVNLIVGNRSKLAMRLGLLITFIFSLAILGSCV